MIGRLSFLIPSAWRHLTALVRKMRFAWLVLFSIFALVLPPRPAFASASSSANAVAATPAHPMPAESGQGAFGASDNVAAYAPFDFLKGYLTNETWPLIIDGTPWDFSSTNMFQLAQPLGGNSYWDYWGENESWDSPSHLWRDEQGKWYTFKTETIKDAAGNNTTAYVLFEKNGPGVMDKLWFTHDCVSAFLSVLSPTNPLNQILNFDLPDQIEWGNLSRVGNLRIEVDGLKVFDGPIESWFSGDAQQLTPTLKDVLVWRYRQFGSDGNIIPIPYQKHLKVSVYGGKSKPKWFMATGLTLPAGTRVQSYTGTTNDLPLNPMEQLARNVSYPEQYLDTLDSQNFELSTHAGVPAEISFDGAGTLQAIEFQLAKHYDPRQLWLRVSYGNDVGIDLPFLAFFGEANQISLHRSAPVGLLDAGDAYLFYSNFPMPFQNGITLQLITTGSAEIPIAGRLALSRENSYTTQLRVLFKPGEPLLVYGPDYTVDVPGNGKLVGLVLVTKDQKYDQVPTVLDKKSGKEDPAAKKWPMGYLEGNLTITDGAGNARYYSGQEDWAEGGYYFNSGYQFPIGGANRPFAGILRYQGGVNGYATLFRYFNDASAFPFKNGLHLAMQHGTWKNNFAVTYETTLFYYQQMPGASPSILPASKPN